jgi:hypothetical protein
VAPAGGPPDDVTAANDFARSVAEQALQGASSGHAFPPLSPLAASAAGGSWATLPSARDAWGADPAACLRKKLAGKLVQDRSVYSQVPLACRV